MLSYLEKEILTQVARGYQPPHFVFLPEFRGATGFDRCRTADALAIGLYKSRGQELTGFEVKISRGDWLRELKNPDKADSIGQYCDEWFIVVHDAEIVKEKELPKPWGLIVVDLQKKKRRVVKSPLTRVPRPMSVELRSSIIQRCFLLATNAIGRAEELQKVRDEGFKAGEQNALRDFDGLKKLRQQVADFQAASGISIHEWSDGKVMGEAMRVVMHPDSLSGLANSMRRELNMFDSTRQHIEANLKVIEKAVEELEKIRVSRAKLNSGQPSVPA